MAESNNQENQALMPVEPPPPEAGEILPEDDVFHQKVTGRLTAFPFAMSFVLLGILLLGENRIAGLTITLPIAILILLSGFILTGIFRFFASRRREQGLFALSILLLLWMGVIAIITAIGENFPMDEWWPLAIGAIALTFFMTFALEHQHETSLVYVGLLILAATGVAFLVTMDVIPQYTVDDVADYWPLLISFVGITLVPLALRRGK